MDVFQQIFNENNIGLDAHPRLLVKDAEPEQRLAMFEGTVLVS